MYILLQDGMRIGANSNSFLTAPNNNGIIVIPGVAHGSAKLDDIRETVVVDFYPWSSIARITAPLKDFI